MQIIANHCKSLQIIVVIILSHQNIIAQGSCGIGDVPIHDIRSFLHELENINQTAAALELDYEIPLHLVVVKNSAGTYPGNTSNLQNIVGAALDVIEKANPFFEGRLKLILCKVTEIENDTYFDLSSAETEGLYNFYHDDNAATTYIVNTLSDQNNNTINVLGLATFPWASYHLLAFTPSWDEKTLAHEMGHFLGLLHTHEKSYRYTPESEWSPAIDIAFCDCIPNEFLPDYELCADCNEPCDCDCSNSGDFICDTAVDPGINVNNPNSPGSLYCSASCETIDCPISVPVPNGSPIPFTYYPDKTNLMSYYSACRNRFSALQLDRMVEVIALYPSREFLRDLDEPQCDIFIPNNGIVNCARQGNNEELVLIPLKFANVSISENANQLCNKTTDGAGSYSLFDCNIPTGDTGLTVTGKKKGLGDPDIELNGITTTDLIALQRHILNTVPLVPPYRWIAADVNKSGSITTADFILIRKLILQIIPEFPDVPTWRFIPEYAFDNQWDFASLFKDNPFTVQWLYNGDVHTYNAPQQGGKAYFDPLEVHMTNTDASFKSTWSFRAVKSGDINFSAYTQLDSQYEDFYINSTGGNAHDCISTGETFIINVSGQALDTISGYQIGFAFDPAYLEISIFNKGDLPFFTLENFGTSKLTSGELRTLWVDENMGYTSDTFGTKQLFAIYAKALQPICNINYVFSIDTSVMTSNFYKFNGKSVEAILSWNIEQEDIKYFLTNVYPNPAVNHLTFSFELAEPANVNIVVQDAYGNSITHNEAYIQGTFNYTFSNLSSLQGNLLNYSATLGNRVYSGSIVKF